MRKTLPTKLITAPRTVTGYHGCSREAAERIVEEQNFQPSTKTYDWLGEGFYFWEYAPYRALDWATRKCERDGGEPAVVQATVRLGRCLNLLDTEYLPGLAEIYDLLAAEAGEAKLPRNTKQGAHFLDRAIIDAFCQTTIRRTTIPLQTVRGTFPEGEPIYPGSKILSRTHTQIAVRDASCVVKISLVQYS